MKKIKTINRDWKILQKGGAVPYGAGSTSGKYVRLNSSITKTSTNNYTMTITISASSSYVYNGYGVRVYAHIGTQKIYKGTVYISSGECSPSSYTHNFSVSSNTSCYASCVCAYCEDGLHSDNYSEFNNQTSADTATYENPGTAPTNPRLTLDKTGVVEGRVTISAKYDCTKPYGTVYYNYARSTDGSNWVESGWITSSSAGYTVTDIKRGATHYFRVKVKNGIGETSWSSSVSVKANSIPNPPTTLTVNTTRPINSVTLNWTGASEPDGQTITYKVYISKNGGGMQLIATTTSTSYSYNISSDAQGTKYKFQVEAHDTLGVHSTSSQSGEFIKATQPKNATISLNKSGIAEGSVTASGAYSCQYPPSGTLYYQFSYYYTGIGWQDQNWSTTNSYSTTVTTQRGKVWYYRVRVKNDAGTSDWSNTVSVIANSTPTSVTTLIYSPAYPINSMSLSWKAATDVDNQQLTYKVYLSKNDGTFNLIATTTSTNCTYNNSNDAYDTKYKFKVEAYDTLNAFSTSEISKEFFKPTPPSTPNITSPANFIYEDDFSVKWTLSNFYKLNGYYVSQKKINDGEWVQLIPDSTASTMSFPIQSIERGDTVQFRVKAVNEAGQESPWSTIVTTKRNRTPTAVTNIRPDTGYKTNVIDFSWEAATDPDNHSVKYNLYISKNENSYTEVGSTLSTSYKWAIPSQDAGETTYRLKVVTEDELGATNYAIGPLLKKPTPPTKPTGLLPTGGYHEGNMILSWTHSNWYNQTGSYIIEIFNDGKLDKTVTVASNVSSYSYSLANTARGSKVHYRIKARNDFDQESAWAENNCNAYHNQIPEAPIFIAPLNEKIIYSDSPKIILKSSVDVDGQKMIMHVKYKNVIYNSKDNSSYFSKTDLSDNEYIIFKHTDALDVGNNIIEAYVSDGLVNSSKVSTNIKKESNIISINRDDICKAMDYNNRVTAINKTREAYGLLPYGLKIVEAEKDFIKANYIIDSINAIKELTSLIDSYHPDNKFKYSFVYNIPTSDSTFITNVHYNQISDAVNNI